MLKQRACVQVYAFIDRKMYEIQRLTSYERLKLATRVAAVYAFSVDLIEKYFGDYITLYK
jgi:hypothetical protein